MGVVLAALLERQRSGLGQHIDLFLFEVGLFAVANLARAYLLTGISPGGSEAPTPRLFHTMPSQPGGYLVLAVGNDGQCKRLCEILDRPDLDEEERFMTTRAKVENREVLVGLLPGRLKNRRRAHWLEKLMLC